MDAHRVRDEIRRGRGRAPRRASRRTSTCSWHELSRRRRRARIGSSEALPRARAASPRRDAAANTPFEKLRARLREQAARSRASRPRHTARHRTRRACTTCASPSAACVPCSAPAARSSSPIRAELDGRLRRSSARRSAPFATSTCSCEQLGDEAAGARRARRFSGRKAAPRSPLPRAGGQATVRLRALLRSDAYLTLLDDTAAAIDSLEPSAAGLVTRRRWRPRPSRTLRKAVRCTRRPSRATTSSTRCGRPASERATPPSSPETTRGGPARQGAPGRARRAPGRGRRGRSALRELAAKAPPGEQALAAGRLVEREDEQPRRLRAAQWPRGVEAAAGRCCERPPPACVSGPPSSLGR